MIRKYRVSKTVNDAKRTETVVEFDSNRFHYRIKDLNKSRVFTTHRNIGYAIISAFKSNPLKDEEITMENLKATENLEKDLRRLNLGFRSSLGGYRYFNPEGNRVAEEEISFFVPFNSSTYTEEEFLNVILNLANKYEQETVLIKLPSVNDFKESYVSPKNSNVELDFNNMRVTKEDDEYYTKLKGNRVQFTLDTATPTILDTYYGYRIPAGFIDRRRDYKFEEESIKGDNW